MANKLNNCYLINAPAGSGKTTEIKSIVQRCIIDNPKDNILCITYTNRAADELSKGILSKNVFIGTIHSFLHFFLKPYFAHQDILELYFEIYGAQISERIDNKSQKESIAESNARYIEKYGKLDYDMVRNNIKVLSYNESPFSSLYYGGWENIARSTTRRSHCRRNCLPPLPRPCSRSCVSFTPATRAGPILQSGF